MGPRRIDRGPAVPAGVESQGDGRPGARPDRVEVRQEAFAYDHQTLARAARGQDGPLDAGQGGVVAVERDDAQRLDACVHRFPQRLAHERAVEAEDDDAVGPGRNRLADGVFATAGSNSALATFVSRPMAVAAAAISFTPSEQRSMLWLQDTIHTDVPGTAAGPSVGTAVAVPSFSSVTRASAAV
jgi:hypothetical protein